MLKIVRLDDTNEQLMKEIKEATHKNTDRQELTIDEDGFKRFNGVIFVPKEKEQAVMRRFHDDVLEGHPGIARSMEKIQRSFYFAGMHRKLKKYIKECDSCNRNKNIYQKPLGKMTIEKEPPSQPWKQLTADFMEMPSTTGITGTETYDELLLVVDTFSKQTVMIESYQPESQQRPKKSFSYFGREYSLCSEYPIVYYLIATRYLKPQDGNS
jgi:integrase-like protein